MFKFKVGDKLVLKEEGITSGTGYDSEQLERLKKYGFIEVTDVGVGMLSNGYAVAMLGNYWAVNKLWVSKEDLEDYYVLKQEHKLTPKLIESLDELQVGDYFKDIGNTLHEVIEIHYSADYPIETRETVLNLAELISMGAYKVKVEPYEMVEVKEEVKPKLYELVEGESYVKLERGDVVKFKDGNVHEIHAVDADDNCNPYCMYFMGDSWWVEAHYFLPENIISINGVNIHEEVVEKDSYEGWVEGAKVRCLQTAGAYVRGNIYTLGLCNSHYSDNDFGVKSDSGIVFKRGCLSSDAKPFINKDILEYFELVKE